MCAFGARGPARYFGGETALAARITAALADLGVENRTGVADGLFAALLAARDGTAVPPGGTARFLAAQPVSVLADQDLAGSTAGPAGLAHARGFRRAARPRRGQQVRRRGGVRAPAGPRPGLPAARDPAAARRPVRGPGVRPAGTAGRAGGVRRQGAGRRACTTAWPPAGWPASGCRSRSAGRTGGRAAGGGGTTGCCPRPRSPNGSAGSSTDGSLPRRVTTNAQGGIISLRLVPDQVVRATGQQLALWGETVVSDRVARAAMRVQAMLGHEAVLRPVLGGGRNAGDQVTPIPFGEKTEPRLPAGRPWPGRIGGPAPGLVFPAAREAEVTDGAGRAVTVSGRCAVSAAPARLAVRGEPPRRVTGWAGPWPLSERWWDPSAARRRARFQLATEDGRAWLAVVSDGRWLVEAGYWLVGWDNPPVPWRELRRRMSWGRLRRKEPPAAGPPLPAIPRPPRSPPPRPGRRHPVGRTALPLLVQLPGRGGHPRRAGRRGRPARARGARPHRPRRHVRGAAVRAGRARGSGPGGPKLGTVFGAELSLGAARQPGGDPTRRGATCSSWPGTPKATGGCAP